MKYLSPMLALFFLSLSSVSQSIELLLMDRLFAVFFLICLIFRERFKNPFSFKNLWSVQIM